mgnify:FL=1|jgi:hypothetical protein
MKTNNDTSEVWRARLNAAAALIPIIESGLATSKLAPERAALMCEFCQWANDSSNLTCEESQSLSKIVADGLARLKSRLA